MITIVQDKQLYLKKNGNQVFKLFPVGYNDDAILKIDKIVR